MSAPLFVAACSLTKAAGGVAEYEGDAAILASLGKNHAKALIDRRNAVRKYVKGGSGKDWQGIRLADHPHNRTLGQGDDFGGNTDRNSPKNKKRSPTSADRPHSTGDTSKTKIHRKLVIIAPNLVDFDRLLEFVRRQRAKVLK